MVKSPLQTLRKMNVSADRRHDRRSLTDEEFCRLIAAAESGKHVEGMSGPDRAMLYIMASWTGFRRRELSSLTRRSLFLDVESPYVLVEAAYSKRRKEDRIPLHPTVVDRLRNWLPTRPASTKAKLFELRTPSGKHFRKTAQMMRVDLAAARTVWISESKSEEEKQEREESDFLAYKNESGLYADFHANRHTFISRLGRIGISMTTAQKLARHSDPRLTANVYTHVEDEEKAAAISSLPGLPPQLANPEVQPEPADVERSTDSTLTSVALVAPIVALSDVWSTQFTTLDDAQAKEKELDDDSPNSFDTLRLDAEAKAPNEVHPTRFELVTFGFVGHATKFADILPGAIQLI